MHFVQWVAVSSPPADNAKLLVNQGQLLLNALIGTVLPMLVAVVTHRVAADWLKSACLLALSVLGSLLTTVSVAHFHWQDFAVAFMVQFGAGVVAHFGAHKPLGITGSNGLIQTLLSGGIGQSTSDAQTATGGIAGGDSGGVPDPAPG